MELTVNKDDLAKALNNVEGIASAKTSMPILENILLMLQICFVGLSNI